MMMTRIVVGVDGSAGSTAALRWAAAEAGLRKAELRVLTAYHRQHSGLHFTGGQGRPAADRGAAAVVHAAVMQARSIAPDVEVRGVALPGYAVPALLQAAKEAALLVVGDRGNGGLPGLPYGSVGSQVATHARRSVVVVRGRSGADAEPVVVGVDDSPSAGTIGRAFDPWREKYPEVTAEREVIAGRTDKVLVQRSQQAQLVVVGPRGHGFVKALLGAVGTPLLQRADCPVLIARS